MFALNSELSIFKMVENAYKVTLVAAFAPLAFDVYWSRANTLGGLLAALGSLVTWITCEILWPKAEMPPQLASFTGMIVGGFVPASMLRAANQKI